MEIGFLRSIYEFLLCLSLVMLFWNKKIVSLVGAS